jgi:hypothetical protein
MTKGILTLLLCGFLGIAIAGCSGGGGKPGASEGGTPTEVKGAARGEIAKPPKPEPPEGPPRPETFVKKKK